MPNPFDLEVLVARWALDELGPQEVPRLAAEALQAGCDSPTLRVLAGIEESCRAKVNDLLPAFCREMGHDPPTTAEEAVKVLVDACARELVSGEMPPTLGVRRLWLRSHHFDGNEPVSIQLRPFVALAVELEDWPEGRAPLEASVGEEAAALRDDVHRSCCRRSIACTQQNP